MNLEVCMTSLYHFSGCSKCENKYMATTCFPTACIDCCNVLDQGKNHEGVWRTS